MKKLCIWIVLVTLLVGCSQVKDTVETQSTNEASTNASFDDSFYPIVNLNINTNRDGYYNDFYKSKDFQTIGRQLEVLSTPHFSTDDYYMAEGQQLKQAAAQKDLLKWKTDELVYSLQPQKADNIKGSTNVIMTSSVYELDFYQKSGTNHVLKGMSFGIIIDPKVKPDTGGIKDLSTPLEKEELQTYGKQCIETLYNYIQNNKAFKDCKDLPIVIAVYQATDTKESYIDGKYILSSYNKGSLGSVEKIEYENVIFTSAAAEKVDSTTSAEFAQFKSALKKAATEAIGIVGYGSYTGDKLHKLTIKLQVNVKTYAELQYIILMAAEDLNTRFSKPIDIVVQVHSQDELEAVIYKERGEDAKSIPMNY